MQDVSSVGDLEGYTHRTVCRANDHATRGLRTEGLRQITGPRWQGREFLGKYLERVCFGRG